MINIIRVTPCVGVWIETNNRSTIVIASRVTPCVGVWIETNPREKTSHEHDVTPCVGVWIETSDISSIAVDWGHTLRGCVDWNINYLFSRTEYKSHTLRGCVDWNLEWRLEKIWLMVTPCVGVWIETCTAVFQAQDVRVTPCVGVWIETVLHLESVWLAPSHPAWVCGLKRIHSHKHSCIYSHTLRGCVDWNSNTWCAITHHQSHTLRGCVDWNRCISCGLIKPISHTLRGCVDWNWQPYWSGCQSMVTPCVGVWIETWMGIA